MSKQKLAEPIYENIDACTRRQSAQTLDLVLDKIAEILAEDGTCKIIGFGTFKVKKRAARTARNPATGEPVSVPEKTVVTFKCSDRLVARVVK